MSENFIHEVARSGDSDYDVARGDSLLDDGDTPIKSEIPGVDDACWTQFVAGMITSKLTSVSDSNALGMFEMMPRRLADLGIVEKLVRTRKEVTADDGAKRYRTIWVAVFVPPLTCEKFLKSPSEQCDAFNRSMKDYAAKIASGEIEKPEVMSLSGALAILHRCGPQGLKTWESGERFPTTQAAYDRVAGVF